MARQKSAGELASFWWGKIKANGFRILLAILIPLFGMDWQSLRSDTRLFLDKIDHQTEQIVTLSVEVGVLNAQNALLRDQVEQLKRCAEEIAGKTAFESARCNFYIYGPLEAERE